MKQQVQMLLFKRVERERGWICRFGWEGVIKVLGETRPCFSQCRWQETKALRQFLRAQDKMEMYVLSSRCIYTVCVYTCVSRGWNRLGSSVRWPPRRGEEMERGMIILCSPFSSVTGSALIDSLSFPSCRSTWGSSSRSGEGLRSFYILSTRERGIITCPLQDNIYKYIYIF